MRQYLPLYVSGQLEATTAREPASEQVRGAVLFTDIVEFNRLTGRYAEMGAEGAERLAHVLDTYFGRMTQIVLDHGGDVVDFIGDAIVAVWRGDGPETAARQAARCAAALQGALDEVNREIGQELQQRVAISAGELRFCLLGGGERWHWLLAGVPMVGSSAAYRESVDGEVVVCAAAWGLTGFDAGRSRLLPGGHRAIAAGRLAPAPSTVGAAMAGAIDTEHAERFMPPMARRQARGAAPWAGEFRIVSSLFLRFPGIDLDRAGGLRELQAAVTAVQGQVAEYAGSFERLSMDDKGITALCAFGLPFMAHEDDAVRAVRAALGIREELRRQGIACSIGVARGRVFYGDHGGEQRRHLGLVGASVNLAARLMTASGDAIFCDEETRLAAGKGIRFASQGRLELKGQAAGTAVYQPQEVLARETLNFTGAMVDRAEERRRLGAALEGLLGGSGGFMVVSGEAGIGKSRLLAEAIQLARGSQVQILECAGAAIEASTPYYPWRRLLLQLLSGGRDISVAQLRARILQRFRDDPRLLSWAPLLNEILPLGFAENDITRLITGAARASSIQAMLIHLLRQQGERGATLLVVDDLHWFDEASVSALARLMQEGSGLVVMVLAGTRPMQQAAQGVETMLRETHNQILVLEALPPEEIPEFIGLKLGAATVPAELTEFVFRRAAGHALYTEELLRALLGAGIVRVEGQCCLLSEDFGEARLAQLPETLEGVIVTHFDRLDGGAQALLKGASVAGRDFVPEMLADMLPELSPLLRAHLRSAQEETFVVPLGADGGYSFRHALLRDVIYGLMPFAQRRDLHARAARWLERAHPDQLDARAPELAQHCEAAGDFPRALDYLERAAALALRQYSNREAIAHIRKAFSLAGRHQLGVPPERLARWEEMLGEAYHELFAYGNSPRHFLRSLQLIRKPAPEGTLALVASLLWQLVEHGAWRMGMRRLTKGPQELLQRRSHIFVRLAESAYFASEPLQLLHHTITSLNLAERSGSVAHVVNGFGALGIGFVQTGLYRLSSFYHRRSMEIARGRGELADIAFAGTLGIVQRATIADWDSVERLDRESSAIYLQLGAEVRWHQNRALVYHAMLARGQFDEAEAAVAEARLRMSRDTPVQVRSWIYCMDINLALLRGRPAPEHIDNLRTVQTIDLFSADRLRGLGLSALAWLRLDDMDRALSMAENAVTLLQTNPPNAWPAWDAFHALVEVYLAVAQRQAPGRDADPLWRRARQLCQAFRVFTRATPMSRARALFADGRYRWATGDVGGAQRRWRRALSEAERMGLRFDRALAHYELGATGAKDAALHAASAGELLAQCGIDARTMRVV